MWLLLGLIPTCFSAGTWCTNMFGLIPLKAIYPKVLLDNYLHSYHMVPPQQYKWLRWFWGFLKNSVVQNTYCHFLTAVSCRPNRGFFFRGRSIIAYPIIATIQYQIHSKLIINMRLSSHIAKATSVSWISQQWWLTFTICNYLGFKLGAPISFFICLPSFTSLSFQKILVITLKRRCIWEKGW